MRQVVIAQEGEMADGLLVVVDVSTKSVVKVLLTLLARRHNNLILRAREDVDGPAANICRVVDIALGEQFLCQRDVCSRGCDRI